MKLKIISDGTNTGTHLVDIETGERIQQISKIFWEADAQSYVTSTVVELINIPVEIVTKANVDLLEINAPEWNPVHTKSFEKEIKITTDQGHPGTVPHIKVYDHQTNEIVGAIQKVRWEATPDKREAKVVRIRFDKKDWV